MAVPTGWKTHSIHRRVEELAARAVDTPPGGTAFYVWAAYGDDGADGLTPGTSLATVKAALDKCTDEKHDTVYLIACDTSDQPATAIAWSKDMPISWVSVLSSPVSAAVPASWVPPPTPSAWVGC